MRINASTAHWRCRRQERLGQMLMNVTTSTPEKAARFPRARWRNGRQAIRGAGIRPIDRRIPVAVDGMLGLGSCPTSGDSHMNRRVRWPRAAAALAPLAARAQAPAWPTSWCAFVALAAAGGPTSLPAFSPMNSRSCPGDRGKPHRRGVIVGLMPPPRRRRMARRCSTSTSHIRCCGRSSCACPSMIRWRISPAQDRRDRGCDHGMDRTAARW